ncbi:MAG: tetratricopeptide repeat protein [Deltaproteobacteria bacterium]|nr:tetratricopeptide repeat protein [Deltaproteobacteria bacterium]
MLGSPPGEGPKSFPYFFLLALFLGLVLGWGTCPLEAGAQKSDQEALSRFDRLAEEATLLNKRGKFDEVISLLQPHKADPKNDSALFFNELGIACRNKGQLEEAILAYQKALSLDPDNPVVMKNLGDAFYLKKEYARAVEICQKALKSSPRFHQARSTLGLAYYRLGKFQEAQEEFEVVLKMNPQDEQARNFREAARKKLQEKK